MVQENWLFGDGKQTSAIFARKKKDEFKRQSLSSNIASGRVARPVDNNLVTAKVVESFSESALSRCSLTKKIPRRYHPSTMKPGLL